MSEIITLLNELQASYESKGCMVGDSLSPPLTAEEIKEKTKWFPAHIPESIKAMYTWSGGHTDEYMKHPLWFRDNIFYSPDLLAYDYKLMIDCTEEDDDGEELYLKTCFPFASFEGSIYVVPVGEHPWSDSYAEPVICVYEGIDVFFHSIESMLKTCIEWVQKSTYNAEDECLELDDELETQIWEKHNPDLDRWSD